MADYKAALKEYGYFTDDTFQENVAQMCVDAAKDYLRGAGIKPLSANSLYDLLIVRLAAYWYDHRSDLESGTVSRALEKGVQAMIHQLHYAGEEDHVHETDR